MNIGNEIEKLLLKAGSAGEFCPDEYEIRIADLIRDWREVDNADVGIVGIPFDTSSMTRRGSSYGPEEVRRAVSLNLSYEVGVDVDLSEGLQIVDFGNIDVVYTDVLKTHERIEKVITAIYGCGVIPVVIGGDHGTSYPTVKSLINSVKGNIGVIMFDAHLDVRRSRHGEIASGTPFFRMMEEPEQPLLGRNLVEIGINGWRNLKYYMDYCREKGVTVISAREVHKRGIEDVVAQALGIASDGTEAIFLSIDIDGLDFAFAPGTCSPNPGGLTSYQGLEAVWLIGQHPLSRGMDIMEVAPALDVQGLTSKMAAALVMQYLAATKRRMKEK